MIASVQKGAITRGYISAGTGSDVYMFSLEGYALSWVYRGKRVGEGFIPSDVQGLDHIPFEWYQALDRAWHAPNHYYEFEDPMESLEVQGA